MATSMYIRVKRQRSTAFLHLSPSDTVAAVKQKLKELYDIDPKNQRLYKDGTVLEDNRSLAELKIETDDVLVVAFQIDGAWESPTVEEYEVGLKEDE